MKDKLTQASFGQAELGKPTGSLPGVAPKAEAGALPAIVAEAGSAAHFAWEEFIYGKLRKPCSCILAA